MAFGEALKQDWNGQLGWISLDLVGLAMFIISFWAGAEFLNKIGMDNWISLQGGNYYWVGFDWTFGLVGLALVKIADVEEN